MQWYNDNDTDTGVGLNYNMFTTLLIIFADVRNEVRDVIFSTQKMTTESIKTVLYFHWLCFVISWKLLLFFNWEQWELTKFLISAKTEKQEDKWLKQNIEPK